MSSPAREFRNKVQADHPGSVVVERGLNYIKHQKPDESYILDASIGPLHYGSQFDQEIDTAWVDSISPWDKEMTQANYNAYALTDFSTGQVVKYIHPGSGEEIAFQPQQLQFTNDLDQIQSVGDVQSVSAVVDDDELQWIDAYGPDIDFTWETQTSRLAKKLTIHNLAALGTPAQYILDGGNPVLRLQFIFQVSQNVDIYINGEKWGKSKTTATSGFVEFRHATSGEVLWHFNKGHAYQEDGDEIYPELRFRKQANRLFVEVRTPWAWLENASYPVVIDPTVDDQVGASDEDAWEKDDGTGFDDTSVYIRGVSNTSASTRTNGGFFFNNITIAQAATIDVAYTTIVPAGTSYDDPNINIRANDVDNAVDFTADADVTTRVNSASTSNYTEWIDTSIGTASQNSPSIIDVVQEVINRGGWSSGNDMVILFEGKEDANYDFRVISYDESTSDCAKLHIEYTAISSNSISVSDGLTVGESTTVDLISGFNISVSDGLTLGESSSGALDPPIVDWYISVDDGITLADPITLQIASAEIIPTFIGRQETTHEVWLCDQYGRRLTIVDNLIDFEIIKVVNSVSYCSITLPGNFHATYQTLIGVDYMVEFWRSPAQGAMQLESVFFVRDITYEEDIKGNDIIILAGPDANDLLDRRIVAYYAGSSQSSKTDNADDMMKEIILENFGSSALAPRDITDLNFTIAGDISAAPSITKGFSWRNVLKVLQDIAYISEENGTNLYFDVVPKVISSSEIGFEFQTFTNQRGQDRTYDSNNPIMFSKEWGNLSEPILRYDYTREANFIYAGGQGEGDYRELAEASDDARIGTSVWNRREKFADARNEATSDGVANKAEEVLRENVPLKRFTGKLLDTPQARYGVNWFFGDKVEISYRDIQFQGIVRALRIKMDKEGNEIITAKVEVIG